MFFIFYIRVYTYTFLTMYTGMYRVAWAWVGAVVSVFMCCLSYSYICFMYVSTFFWQPHWLLQNLLIFLVLVVFFKCISVMGSIFLLWSLLFSLALSFFSVVNHPLFVLVFILFSFSHLSLFSPSSRSLSFS